MPEPSPNDKVHVPKKSALPKTYSRDQLLGALYQMPPEKLNWVIFFLRIPKSGLPTDSQYDRAQLVMRFVEQPDGVGLGKLSKAILKATPHLLGEKGNTEEGKRSVAGIVVVVVVLAGLVWFGKRHFFPAARCGDGIVQDGEQCDGGVGCRPDCTTSPEVALAEPHTTPPQTKPAEAPKSVPIQPTSTNTPQSAPQPQVLDKKPTKEPVSLRPGIMVRFWRTSADLDPAFYPILDEVVETMQQSETIKIRAEGYTDADGSAASNEQLSRHRADAVVEYLVSKGIDRSRLEAVGCGASTTTTSSSEKSKNLERRVEIIAVDGKSKTCGH